MISATEKTALDAMAFAAASGPATEAALIAEAIRVLVRTGMTYATAAAVAQIVYNAHYRAWQAIV